MNTKDKYIQKLEEVIMHVGGFGPINPKRDIVDELKFTQHCPECWELADELSSLKAKMEKEENSDSVIDHVHKWNFIANHDYPKKDGRYWVMDNKGNVERVTWSNSGYMNEPYNFSHGQIINSVQIVCWSESILPSMPKLQKLIKEIKSKTQ